MAKRQGKLGRHLYWRGKTIYGWYFDTSHEVVKRSTETGDPEVAAAKLAQWERDNADPTSAARRDATLGDAFDLLFADRKELIVQGKRSPASMKFYEDHAHSWLIYAGRLIERIPRSQLDRSLPKERRKELALLGRSAALASVDKHFADGFITHRRAQGIKDNTIAKQRIVCSGAIRLAKRKGIWAGDLDELFPPGFGTGAEPKRVSWTFEEAGKVLSYFEKLPHRRAMVAFILATGAEEQAVLAAQRADLDVIPIPLRGTKTKDRARSCPVLFLWQAFLLDDARTHGDGEKGLLFSPWVNSARDLKQACEATGARRLSAHGLRHVFGGWCLDEGLSEGIVGKALGHRDLRQIVLTYDGRDPQVVQRRAEEQIRRLQAGVRNG